MLMSTSHTACVFTDDRQSRCKVQQEAMYVHENDRCSSFAQHLTIKKCTEGFVYGKTMSAKPWMQAAQNASSTSVDSALHNIK